MGLPQNQNSVARTPAHQPPSILAATATQLFNQIDREGCSNEEEEAKPSTGNDHEVGPSGGGAIDINSTTTTLTGTLCVQRRLPHDGVL